MADLAVLAQDYNLVTICTDSNESLGPWMRTLTPPAAATAAWPATNEAIYIPFTLPVTMIAARMFVYNGTTASGNLDLGIFDTGGNSIITKGTTAQSGTSVLQFLDITDTTLSPGVYYMGCSMDGTTGTTFAHAPNSLAVARTSGVLSQSTAFVLPTTTATFAAAQHAYIPIVGITTRTV